MNNADELMILPDVGMQYLKAGAKGFSLTEKLSREVTMDFLALYRVDEITFEEKAPRKCNLLHAYTGNSVCIYY